MQVVVQGLLTNYDRRPAAKAKSARPAVLLLHGWGDSSKGLCELADDMAKNYDVICLDLPGFGGTDMPKEAWGLSDFAGFVGAFLKKIKARPWAIVGHSNGGAIAVRGLVRGDFAADKLVLLASAGIRGQLRVRLRVLRVLTKAGKVATYPLPSRVKKRLRQKLYSNIGSDLLVAEHMQETFKRVVTDDIQADAAKLTMPALLIYGEDDAAAPVQYGRILHSLIAGSRLEIVSGAGHFLHLDKPEDVRKLIYKFLA
jgi:pimeloyl-ACP methyl ester carboxylesterase